ncbi:serine/threonine-protein phosphatase [Streptomyces sp. SID10853]|uniref:PP2C family protein-serine/threonine phosphatase n=1 Tax=Streptomyces sp. SID10853 TaxID=2706028 RepID=UPI0013BF820B|nr:PP2C family protein-serine/threonine phosphatase [Streptomyces sp. SID10853]NDZ81890.1 serine/threonine-protein phosphatase [Streptomyces sp. SID10853]
MSSLRFLSSLQEPRRHPKALMVVPFALITAVTVVDLLTPPAVHVGPFLVAAPAVTASFAGPRSTAFVGAVALAADAFVAGTRASVTDLNHTYQLAALFLISVFVTFFAYLRARHEREMTHLRWVARAVQRVVMRPLPERVGPLRIASVYLAAEREAQLGGDLYALTRTAAGTRVIIGDVRGKGLDAMGEAAGVLGAFRALAHRDPELSAAVDQLEAGIASDRSGPLDAEGDREDSGEAFVTAAVLDIPDAGPELRLVSRGHPPPLVVRAGLVDTLAVREPAPPLGLGRLIGGVFAAETFTFGVGDVLLLYTDGVIEARDAAGRFYPLPDRIASWGTGGPEALLQRLSADLLRHAGGSLGDDAAMVAIERLPADG